MKLDVVRVRLMVCHWRGRARYYLARDLNSFTLFATHYFELTALADEISMVHNVHLDATEHGDNIVFLHTVQEGPANQSYGIQVAQLAGVPRAVIHRAKQKLQSLENKAYHAEKIELPLQHDLFVQEEKNRLLSKSVVDALKAIQPDQLTPKQALDFVYQLWSFVE